MDDEKKITGNELLALILLSILLIPFGWAYSAYVMSTLWGWFFVPFGLPVVTFWYAMGWVLFFSMYAKAHVKDPRPDKTFGEVLGSLLGKMFAVPSLALLFGWAIVSAI